MSVLPELQKSHKTNFNILMKIWLLKFYSNQSWAFMSRFAPLRQLHRAQILVQCASKGLHLQYIVKPMITVHSINKLYYNASIFVMAKTCFCKKFH